jgi:RNA polymerase sigma-70 factor (ECF subfamily)
MRWQDLPDEELISSYVAASGESGSRQYVDELFRRYHAKVALWCLSFTGDRESAADLAQEICTKAYTNLFSFKRQSKFSTWLYSIARNHCLNAVRTRATAPAMESEEAVMNSLPDFASRSPHATIEREQLIETARDLVNKELEETERLVFTLHFSEELPLEVITRMLSLENPSGAKAYLVSAKRKLERAVNRYWPAKPKVRTTKAQND